MSSCSGSRLGWKVDVAEDVFAFEVHRVPSVGLVSLQVLQLRLWPVKERVSLGGKAGSWLLVWAGLGWLCPEQLRWGGCFAGEAQVESVPSHSRTKESYCHFPER